MVYNLSSVICLNQAYSMTCYYLVLKHKLSNTLTPLGFLAVQLCLHIILKHILYLKNATNFSN